VRLPTFARYLDWFRPVKASIVLSLGSPSLRSRLTPLEALVFAADSKAIGGKPMGVLVIGFEGRGRGVGRLVSLLLNHPSVESSPPARCPYWHTGEDIGDFHSSYLPGWIVLPSAKTGGVAYPLLG
jgi:hypothetical protein